ncbi:uncharacterized protein METZ01_LOCUS499266, partial [marine metagenome]
MSPTGSTDQSALPASTSAEGAQLPTKHQQRCAHVLRLLRDLEVLETQEWRLNLSRLADLGVDAPTQDFVRQDLRRILEMVDCPESESGDMTDLLKALRTADCRERLYPYLELGSDDIAWIASPPGRALRRQSSLVSNWRKSGKLFPEPITPGRNARFRLHEVVPWLRKTDNFARPPTWDWLWRHAVQK